MRRCKLVKQIERTLNTAPYENVRITEGCEVEIEFNSASEFAAKSQALTDEVLDNLECSVAKALERLKRSGSRASPKVDSKAAPAPVSAMAKPAPAGAPAGLDEIWGDEQAESYK